MKKLSVEEYAKLMNVSTKTVYRRVERGQLITCKDTVNNKEVIRIIVDDNELLSQDMSLTHQSAMTNDVLTQGQNEEGQRFDTDDTPLPRGYLELFYRMYEDNKSLSEIAGQAKLLTDSERNTREEYFKTVQENKQLIAEKAQLLAKTEILAESLEKTKQDHAAQIELLHEKLQKIENEQKSSWFKKL